MAILADFSPYLEPLGIDEAYLDATGFESIHGSIKQMAEKIRQRIKDELGLCASVGIAGSKVVAKIASDMAKPDGLLEVPAGEEGAFLEPLPVAKLPGVGKKSQQILKDLGVSTIGELAKLPLDTLKSHFGAWGEMLRSCAKWSLPPAPSPPAEKPPSPKTPETPPSSRRRCATSASGLAVTCARRVS
jgi:DNA polymerase-4